MSGVPDTCRVSFWVPGSPAPQGSKAFKGIRGGRAILVESCKAVGPWRERVALVAHQAMREAGNTGPYAGATTVDLRFVLPRPKSAPKTKVVAATKRPDLDKLARSCLDAITNVVVCDDAQVVGLVAQKRVALLGEEPGCQVTVTEGP